MTTPSEPELPPPGEPEPPASQARRSSYEDARAVGLVLASPDYPAARRKFRLVVIISLSAGVLLAIFLPWWVGLLVGFAGTLGAVLGLRRTGRRLEREMRLWLRDRAVSGPHLPGEP